MQEHNDLGSICPQYEINYVLKETVSGDVVREQCKCGFIGSNSLKKSNFELNMLDRANMDLYEKYNDRQSDYLKSKRDEQNMRNIQTDFLFWDKYSEYLRSDSWKNRRLLVLERDNYMCQACLSNIADEVHHLTYKHVFNEPLFDLISVCKPCHDGITKMDRQLL
jgi:hypothetical protein